MQFRIIATVSLLLVLAACYLLFGASNEHEDQASPAPTQHEGLVINP